MPPSPLRPVARWSLRLSLGAVPAGLAVLVILHESVYRGLEAWSAGHATAWLTSAPGYINQMSATFYVDLGGPGAFGLRVTDECTSAVITVGLLGVTAIVAWTTRIGLRRLAVAAVASTATFYLFNLARLAIIALATTEWGMGAGYHWSHVWVGTFVTVGGAIAVFVEYLLIIGMAGRFGARKERSA